MKKFDEFIAWFSVKFSSVFATLLVFAAVIMYQNMIPINNFFLISIITMAIIGGLLTYIRHIDNQVFYQEWKGEIRDAEDLHAIRGKTMWMPLFIGALFMLFFSSLTVGHFFSNDHYQISVNGQKTEGLTWVNPFKNNHIHFVR